MKISDNIETTSGLHVFETPEDLIINSQVYDKFSMEVKPYNFFNINTLLNKNLLLHQVNILEYDLSNPSKEPDYNYYVQDNQDSSIFYCLLEIGREDKNQYFHKIQKKNNKYTLLKSISPDSGYRTVINNATALHYKIIGQTKDNILLIQTSAGSGYQASGYGYYGEGWRIPSSNMLSYINIKKSTMEISYINVSNNHNEDGVYFIKSNDYNIFVLEYIGDKFNITKIDTANNTRTVLYNYFYNTPYFVGISNIIYFKNYYWLFGGTINEPKLFTFQFDNNNLVINTNFRPIYEDKFYKLCHMNATDREDFFGASWIRYSLKNIDDKYIHITAHNNQNKQNLATYSGTTWAYYGYFYIQGYLRNYTYTHATDGNHRHYLLKENNDNWSWNVIQEIDPANEQQFIYGVIYFDKYTPIFHLETGIEIYKLNIETETYNKVFGVSGTFQTIGLDENNNFYTFDVNNKCQMYNLNSCSILNGRFEYDTYNYNGEDIETTVTIASKNFIGELIASKIHVELSGNCKFRNESQEAILTTRLDTEYQVPVIITGPGVVYCNINEVE